MSRWDRFKLNALLAGAILAVVILASAFVGTGDCFYYSAHATDC